MIQADHNTMMQLRTHRVGCTFDYQSMRYTGKRISKVANHEIPPEDVFYVRPPGKYTDRQGKKYEWTQDMYDEQLAMCFSSAIDYDSLRQMGASEEHARSVLATGYLQHGLITGSSFRFWLHLLDVRAKADAQLEVRQVMQGIELEVHRWVPEVWTRYQQHRQFRKRNLLLDMNSHDSLDSLDNLLDELIEKSSYEKDVIDREDLATMLIAAFGELSKFNDSLLEDDRYDELEAWASFASS